MRIIAGIAIVWIVLAGIGYLASMPNGAPQQAAGAAVTMVCMIFPYTIFRILQGSALLSEQKKLTKLLEDIKKQAAEE